MVNRLYYQAISKKRSQCSCLQPIEKIPLEGCLLHIKKNTQEFKYNGNSIYRPAHRTYMLDIIQQLEYWRTNNVSDLYTSSEMENQKKAYVYNISVKTNTDGSQTV